MGSLAILDLNTDIFLFLYSLQFLAEGDWAKPPPCNTPPYTERRFGLRAVKPTLREKRRFDLRARIPAVEPPVVVLPVEILYKQSGYCTFRIKQRPNRTPRY